MLLQQREAVTFVNLADLLAQIKLADQAQSIQAQKRIKGTDEERRRKNLLGYIERR